MKNLKLILCVLLLSYKVSGQVFFETQHKTYWVHCGLIHYMSLKVGKIEQYLYPDKSSCAIYSHLWIDDGRHDRTYHERIVTDLYPEVPGSDEVREKLQSMIDKY